MSPRIWTIRVEARTQGALGKFGVQQATVEAEELDVAVETAAALIRAKGFETRFPVSAVSHGRIFSYDEQGRLRSMAAS